MTMGARIDTRITSLAACVNGSITLSGNDPSRFQIRDQWWKFRYHNEDWTDIRYCNGYLNCVTMSLRDGNELPDGTKVAIGAHESLIVQRTAQNNTKDRIQFLLEIYFQNNSVLRHSFEVNFTVVCVWTRLQANLNLSQVFLGQYPLEQLKEIQLLDENGTYFAYMHTRNGASLDVTDDRSLMPPYWNRLKITRGSLILSGITKADNGTTIRSKAFLNDPAIKTSIGSVSVKTIRIFVFNSTDPSLPPPSFLPNSSFSSTPGKLSQPTKSTNEPQPTKSTNEPAGQGRLIVAISVSAAAMIFTAIIIALIIIFKKGLCCFRYRRVSEMPQTDRPADQC